jgi:hypothetical protein
MTIERSKRPLAAARIATVARRLLDVSTLCAIATPAHEVGQPAARDAEQIYANRFLEFGGADLVSYRFYCFHPRRLKLFDEHVLGAGAFLTARIGSKGGVSPGNAPRSTADVRSSLAPLAP